MNEIPKSSEDELFAAALEKSSAAERSAFLDEACENQPDLRARLEALLQGHFEAAGFLTREPERGSEADAPGLPRERPAVRVDRYKLLEKIGEGGFGEVWMAEQREPIKRRVALKIIKLGMDSRQVVARFEAERQALAMMDHRNIAKIFDGGMVGDSSSELITPNATPHSQLSSGRPYFVMELVRGVKITEYCDQHQLPTRERLELFIQVCQAIQHAHQKGVIHRDIKPSNILVTLHDGVPVPKVIDFGIAKATQGELTDKTVFTHFQQFIGTPAYISPEQAEMSGLDVDTRSDIYSLGVLLYELLVGQTPFDTQEMLKGGIDALRKMIREKDPHRPSTRLTQELATATAKARKAMQGLTMPTPEEVAAETRRCLCLKEQISMVRGDLDWIVMKCLEKNRARRYETANGLAADVRRFLLNQPVTARSPSIGYTALKLWQRRRGAVVSGSIAVVTLIIGFSISTWQALRATRAERIARERWSEVVAERDARIVAQAILEKRNLELRRSIYASALPNAITAAERGEFVSARDILNRCEAELRGWEWGHLSLRSPFLHSFPGGVGVGAFMTRDGERVLSLGVDSRLRSWDAHAGTQLRSFDIQQEPKLLSLSRDERSVAVAVGSGGLALLDQATGGVRWMETNHLRRIYSIAFSPDERHLASAGADGRVILWSLAGQPLRTNQSAGVMRGLAFSPDSRFLLAGNVTSAARMLKADSLDEIGSLEAACSGQQCVDFSPDGRRFVTGDADGFVRVWDSARRQVLVTSAFSHFKDLRHILPERFVSNVTAVAFSPDGERIASAGTDAVVRLWDATSGRLIEAFPSFVPVPGWTPMVGFSSDGSKLLVSGGASPASGYLWNLRHDRHATLFKPHPKRIWAAAFTRDSRHILTAGWDRRVVLSDAIDGRRIRTFEGHQRVPWSVVAMPDRLRAATTAEDGTLRVWDLETGRTLRVIQVHESPTNATDRTLFLALNPDGRLGVSGGYDGRVQLWDLNTGARLWQQTNRVEAIWAMAWSSDGKTIAAGGTRGRLTLMDAVSGRELSHTNLGTNYVNSLAFRPDRPELLTGNLGGELSLVDTSSGQLLRRSQSTKVRSVAFSPDGRRMVSGGDDGLVRIWDPDPLETLLTLPAEAGIHSVVFSPDGKRLLGACSDGTARVWHTD